MVPNPEELNNFLENPVRSAAIHFGAYLQLKGALQCGEENYGTIMVDHLLDQFTNHYQLEFHSPLVRQGLLGTLRRYRVILKSRRQDEENNLVRIAFHPDPDQVRPANYRHRQRIHVDQTRALRDKPVHVDVFDGTRCRLCNEIFRNEDDKQKHVDSDIHKFRLQYREKRSSFKSTVGNARIFITETEINEKDIILRTDEQRTVTVKVTHTTPYTVTNVHKIIELDSVKADPTEFHNDAPIAVNVTANFSEPGAYIYPLVAKIMPARLCLLKDLVFRVESELMDKLAPTAPYIHQNRYVIREMEGPIISGEELEKSEFKLKIKVPLREHKVSPVYNNLLLHKLDKFDQMTSHEEEVLTWLLRTLCGGTTYKDAIRQISRTKAPFIAPLQRNNYSERFALLVDLEELQQQLQIKYFDRHDETLKQCNTKFLLQVPDLSESHLSLKKGDKVHVRLHGSDEFTYEGVIHEVQETGLLLGFHREFISKYERLKTLRQPRVDVRFLVNNFPMRNMHRALKLIAAHHAEDIVFPVRRGSYFPPTVTPTLRPWFNKLIGTNPEQQRAVKNIMNKSSGSAPYLVFGPPGTGKTVTLVETIVQVWHATQTCVNKQLVCAPSNAACDNIAKRLLDYLPPTCKVYRLFSLSAEVKNVPNVVKSHSNYDASSNSMFMPSIEDITKNDIIIATIVTSGRLVTGGAGGFFQYVYIDECGQATEPEALIAVAGVLTTKRSPNMGQLVLAGDPQQLGPILSSQPAKDFGLGMSLLERLMNHIDLYKKDNVSGYDSNYLTKLVQNYRSHETILHLPNQLFYDNELQVRGNPDIIKKAVCWQGLPNKDFPVIFHGVQGIDERESNSPSYFNRQEIDRVIMYMEKLFETGLPKYKVKQEDIGVITPYRKQVSKLRKAFSLKKWDKVQVDSVEKFQGSEKLIIIISTVRSNIALVDADYRYKLGFLKNPKRFNVSLTRAKALLIVVGNPNILRHDKQWYELLKYCRDNDAAIGIPFPDDDPPEHQQEHIAS